MVDDASFSDGGEAPLHLQALDGDDLQILSALAQDAVFPITEMAWQRGKRRLALLVNRFRWEDHDRARKAGRAFERVQSLLVISDVMRVTSSGIDRNDTETVLSLLSVSFQPGEDGTGVIDLILAGDGAIRTEVEALDVVLKDVTRPYRAPSKSAPSHDD
ncbi:MAG: DUF2948 family protein [Rhodobacteraceae bacterium]|nr:DUF2948 family protein [Paracoccaceae bacterium]